MNLLQTIHKHGSLKDVMTGRSGGGGGSPSNENVSEEQKRGGHKRKNSVDLFNSLEEQMRISAELLGKATEDATAGRGGQAVVRKHGSQVMVTEQVKAVAAKEEVEEEEEEEDDLDAEAKLWKTAYDDKRKCHYYWRIDTRETTWTKPECLCHTATERREIKRKEKEKLDFFAAMENNIRAKLQAKRLSVDVVVPEKIATGVEKPTKTGGVAKQRLVARTISSVDDSLLVRRYAPAAGSMLCNANLLFKPHRDDESVGLKQSSNRRNSSVIHSPLKPKPTAAASTKNLRRRNSTSSVHMGHYTLAEPDQEGLIKCVCTVVRAHIIEAVERDQEELRKERQQSTCAAIAEEGVEDGDADKPRKSFSDFDQKASPPHHRGLPGAPPSLERQATLDETAVPSSAELVDFFRKIYKTCQLETECIVVALIYVERLLKATEGRLHLKLENWRPVLLSALMLASKISDDLTMWNADFSVVAKDDKFDLRRVNDLEMALLKALDYRVTILASEYAKYYFHLRSMCAAIGLGSADDRFHSGDEAFSTGGALRLATVSKQFTSKISEEKDSEAHRRRIHGATLHSGAARVYIEQLHAIDVHAQEQHGMNTEAAAMQAELGRQLGDKANEAALKPVRPNVQVVALERVVDMHSPMEAGQKRHANPPAVAGAEEVSTGGKREEEEKQSKEAAKSESEPAAAAVAEEEAKDGEKKGEESKPAEDAEGESATRKAEKRRKLRRRYSLTHHPHENLLREDWLTDVESVYEMGRVLGTGICGTVREVTHRKSGKHFAMKTLRLTRFNSKGSNVGSQELKDLIQSMKNEIDCQRSLNHPNIVRILEVYEKGDRIYLIMEFCTGGELLDRLNAQMGHHYVESTAQHYIHTILTAVRYCHRQGVVHRDLKLENLLMEHSGPDADVKLTDFGLSRHFSGEGSHEMHEACGTVNYLAPEVLTGSYTEECDLWSVGVIAFMLLCGAPPFFPGPRDRGRVSEDIGTLRAIRAGRYEFPARYVEGDNPWISASARDFVTKLLIVNPDERMTAEEALGHPWMKNAMGRRRWRRSVTLDSLPITVSETTAGSEEATPAGSSSSTEGNGDAEKTTPRDAKRMESRIHSNVIFSLREFSALRQMKKVALEIIAFNLQSDEIRELADEFEQFDLDGTGEIGIDAFKKVLQERKDVSDSDIERIFSGIDINHSGRILYNEYLAGCISRRELDEQALKDAFDKMDIDGTGTVTVDNLREIVGADMTEDEVKVMVLEAGADSGTLDLDLASFMRLMRSSDGVATGGVCV